MSSQFVLQKFLELSKEFDLEKTSFGFEFTFAVSSNSIELLDSCVEAGLLFSAFSINDLYLELDELRSRNGEHVKCELTGEDLSSAGANVYWSWGELLAYRPNLIKAPSNFLVLEDYSLYPSDSASQKIVHYLDICKVIRILISNADHTVNLTDCVVDELIYLHKSRLEIPVVYAAESLGEGLDGVSIICALFDDKSHNNQKNSILKEVIYSLVSNIPKQERLQYILVNFGEFSKRLNENYQLFVSEFSFDEVRKEYEEYKRDYFSRLNDVFTSVQTKMLGIPISLALASLKMSSIVDDITFWTNLLLVLSIIIYGTMMVMLITNQKHTLSAIKSEYDSQMARLKHQYTEQYEKIKSIQDELNSRYEHQNTCLNWFYVMSVALFVLVLALFFWNLPWKVIIGIA